MIGEFQKTQLGEESFGRCQDFSSDQKAMQLKSCDGNPQYLGYFFKTLPTKANNALVSGSSGLPLLV